MFVVLLLGMHTYSGIFSEIRAEKMKIYCESSRACRSKTKKNIFRWDAKKKEKKVGMVSSQNRAMCKGVCNCNLLYASTAGLIILRGPPEHCIGQSLYRTESQERTAICKNVLPNNNNMSQPSGSLFVVVICEVNSVQTSEAFAIVKALVFDFRSKKIMHRKFHKELANSITSFDMAVSIRRMEMAPA